ncbi:MAG: glycosyltransferase family 39 protein [Rhizobiales bacterium]|nr:glycosyltransferase family 39 protein [Hyphomicrobiales bacterium]
MIARAVGLALSHPRYVLLCTFGLHLIVWTLLPPLVGFNLQLDLVEDLALGKEWQLGYWKHPPLPWWTADLAFRAVGDPRAVYVLGPVASVVAMYAVWRLGKETVGPQQALFAVLALEGLHFFNFSAVKFNHDVMQLPFWALTGLFLFRAITRERALDWILAGVWLALAFWTKYTAFVLAAPIGLLLLLDPFARRTLRTAGPYLMTGAFLVVIAPHVWWLVAHSFMPFQHVGLRAKQAAHWHEYISFPLRWVGSQVFFLAPVIGLLALVWKGEQRYPQDDPVTNFARRYVTTLAIGPFLLTTLVAGALGRLPVAMWGYPLWSFAPLAAVMWFPVAIEPRRLHLFARGFLLVFLVMPAAYAAIELLEPFLRERPKATQFPGRLIAETITRQWREKTGTPLRYVGGADFGSAGVGEFAANNIAVYSPDRPQVIVHGDARISPWVDTTDLKRRGAVLVWEQDPLPDAVTARLKVSFPNLEIQRPLVIPRQTLYPRKPAIVGYAFVPPEP